jgi:1,4-alpha-glucan branching enzyme
MLNKRFFKTKEEAEITFECGHKDANKIELVAEFNDWRPIEMQFIKSRQIFKSKCRLPTNKEFQFRYLINGAVWENDNQADGYTKNGFGSENSLVSTMKEIGKQNECI